MGANLLAASNYLLLRRLVRFEKEEQGKLDFEHKMRLSGAAFVATLVVIAEASPQGINFGSSSSSEKEEDIANRNYGQQSAPQIQQHQNQQCCCIPQQQQCLQNQHFTQGDDLVGEGLINERIVNRPGAAGQQTLSCASGQRICCYDDHPEDADYDFSVFQRHPSCSQPFTSTAPQQSSGRWVQGCSETSVYGNQQCGTRTYRGPVRGLSEGESSPGEFPWTCLILNQNNDFLGTCALVPQTFNNDLGRGTRKILTAAHNLKSVKGDKFLGLPCDQDNEDDMTEDRVDAWIAQIKSEGMPL